MPLTENSISASLVVAIVAPLVVGTIGFFAGRLVEKEPALEIVISPGEAIAAAGRVVEFSAEGSHDPSGRDVDLTWTVGGLPLGTSSAAGCSPAADGLVLSCQFVMPGVSSVAVTGVTEDGRSGTAVSTVSVEVQNGYLAIIIVAETAEVDAVYRDLQNAIDWSALQAQVRTPILVFDPDLRIARPAATVRQDPSKVGDALAGAKVMVPLAANSEAFAIIQIALEQHGATLVAVPPDQIEASLERGLGEIGLATVSSPEAFLSQISRP